MTANTSIWDSLSNWFSDSKNAPLIGAGIGGLAGVLNPQGPQTRTEQQAVDIPQYAQPYVNDMMGKFWQAADEPYQAYTGQRVAEMNPTQMGVLNQMQGVAGQPLSEQQQQGANVVHSASNQLLNPTATFDQAAAQQYMNPYMQSVLDMNKRIMGEDYAKQLPVMAAQAQARGAFGGSRDAILGAEAQKNYNQRLMDMQTQGMNTAFQQARPGFSARMW